jgi:transcription-repair coupling factor (superfamily II helicase)
MRAAIGDTASGVGLHGAAPYTLGVPDGAKAPAIAALAQETPGPVLIVSARPASAVALAEDIQAWLPALNGAEPAREVLLFPARELLPYEHTQTDPESAHARLEVLMALAEQRSPIIVSDVQALSQRTHTAPLAVRTLHPGDHLAINEFLAALDSAGYQSASVVDEAGTFARRGGIIDVFAVATEWPVRIELLGEEIESLRRFNPESQRSIETVDAWTLGLATEAQVEKSGQALARMLAEQLAAQSTISQGATDVSAAIAPTRMSEVKLIDEIARDVAIMATGSLPKNLVFWTPFLTQATLGDHLPAGTPVVWDEAEDARQHLIELDELAHHTRRTLEDRGEIPAGLPTPHLSSDEVLAALQPRRPRIDLHRFAQSDSARATGNAAETITEPEESTPATTRRVGFGPVNAYGGRLRVLIDDLQRAQLDGHQVALVSMQAPRLAELFMEHGVAIQTVDTLQTAPEPGVITIARGSAPHGWRLPLATGDSTTPDRALIFLTDTEIFGFAKQRRTRPGRRPKHTTFLEDLQPGDLVVHIEHGIARFVGIERQRIGAREREYLELQYADGDRLLVPTDQLHRLQRYVGSSEHGPSLTRLGTQQWQRAKQRVREAVRELAEDLLELYAARAVRPGIAAPADTPWQMELEASFPYVETTDQVAALRDVKRDMESTRPMDRIVVGDVGYGKTEVAIRAAFKAVMAGYQVLVLVPTTILAQQHFATFQERMAPFPVTIEMLSRFRSGSEQRKILAALGEGKIDIVIGTHRLLQADVRTKSLGLLIIDEEQRFGVAHKETLKRLRREVDVLALSATPIPRTMHMALTGIRDMSTIETPPEQRLPITTYVMQTDDDVVREAIMRELERGGQVYFVHNRVQSIGVVEGWLRDLVPEARFLTGHGQMPEDDLERVMTEFVAGEADVLICTTIIESGLDIPNVNTIVIHQAHRFGLAQLYQLRGRVGRSARQAYAYLFYDAQAGLSETAQKRLQTVFEATELGAGFQIALRDLEIRGTGNLLGAAQSGHIGAVGFDLYTQLLGEAVERLRAQEEQRPPKPLRRGPTVSIDLPIVAHIPASYIEDVNVRLAVYQQLAAIEEPNEVETVQASLVDRFGPLPPPVLTLLRAVRIRTLAARLGAEAVQSEEDTIAVRLTDGLSFQAFNRPDGLPDGVRVGTRLLQFEKRQHGDAWLDVLEQILEAFAGRLEVTTPTA